MKNLILFSGICIALAFAACSGNTATEETSATETISADSTEVCQDSTADCVIVVCDSAVVDTIK